MKRNFYRVLLLFLGLIYLLFAGSGAVLAQDEAPAEAGVFQDFDIQPEAQFQVPVSIRGVVDLYAVDISLEFNPTVLAVEDADPDQAGIQPALGTFLDAGLVLFNKADNQAGTVRFTMTQVNPSEPKSGEGVILVLNFRALTVGESGLTVTSVELSDRAGNAIPVEGVDAAVAVSSDAVQQEATSIPVQDPTQAIVVPTLEATPTATPTAVPTPTPTEMPEEESEATAVENNDKDVIEETEESESPQETETENSTSENQGFSLLDYWWAVAILFLVVVGMAVVLFVSKK